MKKRLTCVLPAIAAGMVLQAPGEVVVPNYDRAVVDVAEGESLTQTDAVWVDVDATLDKTGLGRWTLPFGMLTQFHPVDIGVRAGTLAVPSDPGPAPVYMEPTAIMSRAALWIDATQNLDTTNGADGVTTYVKDWRDVRETATAYPYEYLHVMPGWSDPSPKTQTEPGPYDPPTVRANAYGQNKVYCRGYKSGAYLYIATNTSSGLSLLQPVRDMFAVHCVDDGQGFVFSRMASNGERIFHPGTTAGLTTDAIFTPNGKNLRFGVNMDFHLNGRRIDPTTTIPNKGCQLLEVECLNWLGFENPNQRAFNRKGAVIDSFYNDLGITPKNSTDSFAHIGGDDLCEVLIFTNALTRTERVAITRYLVQKWHIGDASPTNSLTVAAGATVELANPRAADDEGALRVAGEGTIAFSGDATAYLGYLNKSFNGSVSLAVGQSAILRDDRYSLVPGAGMRLTATNSPAGRRVSSSSASVGTFAVAANDSEVAVREVPESMTRLSVESGTLRIGPGSQEPTLLPGTNFAVAIANGGFEAIGEGDGWGNGSAYLSPWTTVKVSGNAWCNAWSKTIYPVKNPSGDVLWISAWNAPEGNYIAAIHGAGMFKHALQVTEDGVYDISLMLNDAYASRGSTHWRGNLDVMIVDSASVTNLLGTVVAATELGYVRHHWLTPPLKAGDYTLILSVPSRPDDFGHTYDITPTFDDVRMEFVSRKTSEMPVPNGDFEQVSLPYGKLAYTVSNVNTAVGWTFEQNQWSASYPTTPGVALMRYSMAYGTKLANYVFPARTQDFRTGAHQLSLVSTGGVARTTFKPSATGTFLLRAGVCRHRGVFLGRELTSSTAQQVEASLKIGDGAETSLGQVSVSNMKMETRNWPNAFTISDTNIAVTLSVSNRVGTCASLLDDFAFVPLKDVPEASELIVNGSCLNTGGGWTLVNRRMQDPVTGTNYWAWDRSTATYRSNTSDAYGYEACLDGSGNIYGLLIGDHAGVYQNITFPRPGRYRLRYHVRGRVTYAESARMKYCNGLYALAVLAVDGVTNTVSTCCAATSNFVARTAYIDISDTSKTYAIGFETSNKPEISKARDRSLIVDGISLVYAGEATPPPEMDISESLAVEVAENARLSLEFGGTNRVESVRLGGRRTSGVISAQTCPQYVSGTGALYVQPNGIVISFR